jgi:hypothetical protein
MGKLNAKIDMGIFEKKNKLAPFFIGNFGFDNMPSKYTIFFFC